ncbi:MAG TPA: NADH-quinone oxidoreductase subunit L, partial [Propionibacteriaceae bacterium]|nr:NADH-quinone oxidoreductase subunit L [Propionibacteriaceae bacterium]
MLPLEIVIPVPATGFFTLAWLLIVIPAASSAVLLLVGRRADRWAPYLGAAAPLASFAIGLYYFINLLGREEAT